ncbi:hypothetical protein [Pelagicoccus sp. SDUM812003]|uniref:hypothetical protein n=1 Tax=Pelagicoccus sp. SDUM812003 TaxID=3041267 RepID=UPI00280FBD97|nr:hypothetical protein [Pelagicoccus sp. SDUM812003]MDQ8203339.1 hypothetical protein [Pelagicoccus sp. SDUM812003]
MAKAILRELLSKLEASIDGRKNLVSRSKISDALSSSALDERQAIRLIEGTSKELVTKNLFGGVLLVIDELGKFLEFAALNPEQQDVYFLQVLAESSCRSGNYPVYTLGLLHQGFAEYAAKLPSVSQLEWSKVSERFEEFVFSQPLAQVTALLSQALSSDLENQNIHGWKGQARGDMATAIDLGLFGPNVPKTALKEHAVSIYPIHCSVIPVLAKFFRRFGQNERSLFSFLLSSEPYALQDFASKQRASLETIFRLSDFYDFAAANFSHRLSGQSFRSHWNHIDAVIRSTGNEEPTTVAILKTVGILNVIDAPELAPTFEVLHLALGDSEGLDQELRNLCKRNLLFNRGRSGYALWPYNSVNLEQRFVEASEAISKASPIAETVRKRIDSRPIVARRHYIETGNLRYFEVLQLTASEFSKKAEDLAPTHPADGLVVSVLCESKAERLQSEEIATGLAKKLSTIIAISPPLDALTSSALELERWLWVERQTPELKDDRFAAEEVSRQIATSSQTVENRIQEIAGIRGVVRKESTIAWYHDGELITERLRFKSIQTFLSDLCDELFTKAPKVANELINRTNISSAAASARQKLFKGILSQSDLPLLGLPEDKSPPEKSMYLSVLKAGNIHIQDDDGCRIAFPNKGKRGDPLNLRPALDAIIAALEEQPDRRVPVIEIYDRLRLPPFGVRDGLVPLLLLTVFTVHESEIAIYEDDIFQAEIEENLAMRLARRPETFEFQLCRINGVRKELISEIAKTINTEHAEHTHLLSIVRPLCLFIDQLPEYVQKTDNLSDQAREVRKAIENAREPSDLVFKRIPQALGIEPSDKKNASVVGQELSRVLFELRRSYPELLSGMAKSITAAFAWKGSFEDWRRSISEPAETVLVGLSDTELRSFCFKLIDDVTSETEWLEALGSIITRCPPSRWKDRDKEAFEEEIKKLAGKFNRVLATCFDKNGSLPDSAIRIAITPKSGQEKDVVVSLSPSESQKAKKLRESIVSLLPDSNDVSIAAISELLWKLMEGKQ